MVRGCDSAINAENICISDFVNSIKRMNSVGNLHILLGVSMKKVAVFLICLFSSFNIFSEAVYKVSSVYVEKGNRTDETVRSTCYFVKNKNVLEKYYSNNGRISKEIEVQVLRQQDSISVMIMHGKEICSLYEIKFIGNNSITINDDVYVLEKKSLDKLYANTMRKANSSEISIDTIFSLFSMTPYFLIDGYFQEMPYDLLCNVEQYEILNGRFSVRSPHSNMILKHAFVYAYDEDSNVTSITSLCENSDFGGMNYSLSFTRQDEKHITKKESYSFFERQGWDRVTNIDIDKQECNIEGEGYAYPTSNEYTFSEKIKCEKILKTKHELLNGYFEQ